MQVHTFDVIKWQHFLRYWPFLWGIHLSQVDSPHKGQWRGYLMLSVICTWTNGWANNRDAGDMRRYRAYYDVTIMHLVSCLWWRRHRGLPSQHVRVQQCSITLWNGGQIVHEAHCVFNHYIIGHQSPVVTNGMRYNNLSGVLKIRYVCANSVQEECIAIFLNEPNGIRAETIHWVWI